MMKWLIFNNHFPTVNTFVQWRPYGAGGLPQRVDIILADVHCLQSGNGLHYQRQLQKYAILETLERTSSLSNHVNMQLRAV